MSTASPWTWLDHVAAGEVRRELGPALCASVRGHNIGAKRITEHALDRLGVPELWPVVQPYADAPAAWSVAVSLTEPLRVAVANAIEGNYRYWWVALARGLRARIGEVYPVAAFSGSELDGAFGRTAELDGAFGRTVRPMARVFGSDIFEEPERWDRAWAPHRYLGTPRSERLISSGAEVVGVLGVVCRETSLPVHTLGSLSVRALEDTGRDYTVSSAYHAYLFDAEFARFREATRYSNAALWLDPEMRAAIVAASAVGGRAAADAVCAEFMRGMG